jgi:protein regulator of cytokinesis 1
VISSDESFASTELRDLTPEQFSKLEKDMVRSKNEISRRLAVLGETFEHISWLHTELGIQLPSPDPFLAESNAAVDPNIAFARIMTTFLSSDRSSLDVDPTNDLMDWADRLTTELEQLKDKREVQIQGMYDQLEMLWRRLGIDDNDIDDFVESYRGSTDAVIEAASVLKIRIRRLIITYSTNVNSSAC